MSALQSLYRSVDEFANRVIDLPDASLEFPWRWGDYNEGARFIYFRIYETLRSLTAEVMSQRAAAGRPPTRVQEILGGYQQAYRRLQAVVMGIDDFLAAKPPTSQEWPLRRVVAHVLGAELSFWKINAEALADIRRGILEPPPVSDAVWKDYEESEPVFRNLDSAPLSALMQDYAVLNQRTLLTFVDASDQELAAKVWFWESEPLPMHFRLHRFDSHLAQHTVQAEKTLAGLKHPLTESRRLLFLIYQAMSSSEGALLGAEMDDALCIKRAASEITGFASQAYRALSIDS